MRGPAPDAQEKESASPGPNGGKGRGDPLDGVRIERSGDAGGVLEIPTRKSSTHLPHALHSSAHSNFSVRATSTAFFNRNALLSPRSRSIRSIGTSMNECARRRA